MGVLTWHCQILECHFNAEFCVEEAAKEQNRQNEKLKFGFVVRHFGDAQGNREGRRIFFLFLLQGKVSFAERVRRKRLFY